MGKLGLRVALALLLAGIVILLYRLESFARRHRRRYPRVLISRVYDDLDTGDLVFFMRGAHGVSNNLITGCLYSHVGVVIRRGDRLYLSETQPGQTLFPGATLPHGPFLAPLLVRIKHHVGACHVARLRTPLAPAAATALEAAAAAAAAPYPTLLEFAAGVLGAPVASRHCFQHARVLLRAGGIIADLPGSTIGACAALADLPGGTVYAPAAELLYDVEEDTEAAAAAAPTPAAAFVAAAPAQKYLPGLGPATA